MSKPKKTERWNSRLGVILAVAGSAVGLGNFLRFPGQVAEWGGGAFMIAYFISFIIIGLPICWAEWAMGRYAGSHGFNSAPSVFAAVTKRPGFKYLGIIGVVIPVCIYMYYVVVEAWCLAYATNYLFGEGIMKFEDTKAAGEFFGGLVGIGANGSALAFDMQHVGFYVIGVFILNFILIYRGLSKGIEWFCKFAMPALVVIALVILVRALTLGTPNPELPENNINNGLGYMWNPTKVMVQEFNTGALKWEDKDQIFPSKPEAEVAALKAQAAANPLMRVKTITVTEQLANPSLWLAAASQIFFSLSVGFGVIITYSSYLKDKDDIVLSGLAATSANEFCEVGIGGLLSIPAAVAFFGVSGLIGMGLSTFSIGFTVLPMVFASMPGGMIFGFLFFFLLFLAAVTSSLSMLQPGIAFLEESMQIGRRHSVALLGLITAFGAGFILYFSEGVLALDTIDFWVVNLLMVLLATAQIIIFGWVIGIEKGIREAHRGSIIKIPAFFPFVMKYVTPLLLLLIFGAWVYKDLLGMRIGAPDISPELLAHLKAQGIETVQEARNYGDRIKVLYEDKNVVAWMSVTIIIMTGIFVALTLPASKFFKNLDNTVTKEDEQ